MEPKRKIEISTQINIEKPPQPSLNEKFYVIYSPKKFKLRPFESIMLDLKLKLNLPDNVQGIIEPLPLLILQQLTTENSRHITAETKDGFIKLDILNRIETLIIQSTLIKIKKLQP